MNKHLKLGFLGAAALSLVLVLAARNNTPVPAAESAYNAKIFDAAWRESAGPVALKTASLADTAPKPVVTETILPTKIVESEEEVTPKPKRKITKRGDVCQRHGMRKVFTRGGRSWRCKR